MKNKKQIIDKINELKKEADYFIDLLKANTENHDDETTNLCTIFNVAGKVDILQWILD